MALYFNMKTKERKRFSLLTICFGLSLLLHCGAALYQLATSLDLSSLAKERKNEPIEIAELPKQYTQQQKPTPPAKPSNEQQMAETEDANNREIDPNAKFLGEHNQKAPQQTKAKRVDDFRTKKGTGAKGITDGGQQAPTGESLAEGETPDEPVEGENSDSKSKQAGIKRNWKTLSLKDLGVGGDGQADAATDDVLKGVREGEGTVLSTREFRFYSYYHRIKELLRQYWKPNVERQITRIWNKGKNINSDELTTRVLVLLDSKGTIQKISKVSGSGFTELDEAAVEAFQRAAPFPNPPSGIVDPDGFVRIRWDFILQTDAGPAIQWRSQGAMPN